MAKYQITWSARGERTTEHPVTVEAWYYRLQGDFYAFFDTGRGAGPQSPILAVRASDVREIREVKDDG